jgi:hypothetical protein
MMQNLDSYMIPCLETHSHTFIYYLIWYKMEMLHKGKLPWRGQMCFWVHNCTKITKFGITILILCQNLCGYIYMSLSITMLMVGP